MTTIPTRPTHDTETQRALTLVSNAVSDVLLGHLGTDTSPTPRPIPIAFLDDGRRVFLVIDSPTGRARSTTALVPGASRSPAIAT